MNNGSGLNWGALTQMAQNRLQMMNNTPTQQAQLPLLGVIFVDGRAGVDAFPLPPNCEGVPLFDRNTGELFIKSTDAYNNPKVVEFEAPVPKKTESDIQKELIVAMDERMSRIEDTLAKLVGGDQNGKPYLSSPEQAKRTKSAKQFQPIDTGSNSTTE